ncbi:MAG: 2-phospho-L-lactate guanylyltransferase [Thermoproteota archaeon]|nr:2-phospho-L-lactate guanylyltransferase [Thermoproteota archaeon]
MKTSAIIPVKTFSKAKTRLDVEQTSKEEICSLMLKEVLKTISDCNLISKIILVSKDEVALKIGKQFNAIEIFDNESGVNDAINLADQYISDKRFDCSVIFPQDIPIMTSFDIDRLLGFIKSTDSVIIVPSRQFNGTNALVRCPADLMKTKYDLGSYKFQIDAASTKTKNISIALIRRMMLDIDDKFDLEFMLKQKDKPDFCNQIKSYL